MPSRYGLLFEVDDYPARQPSDRVTFFPLDHQSVPQASPMVMIWEMVSSVSACSHIYYVYNATFKKYFTYQVKLVFPLLDIAMMRVDRSDDGNDSASTDDNGDGNDVNLFSNIAADDESDYGGSERTVRLFLCICRRGGFPCNTTPFSLHVTPPRLRTGESMHLVYFWPSPTSMARHHMHRHMRWHIINDHRDDIRYLHLSAYVCCHWRLLGCFSRDGTEPQQAIVMKLVIYRWCWRVAQRTNGITSMPKHTHGLRQW
jgi:hypothetical protein